MAVRNSGFDAVKGLACIAVVFMHCEFPGMVGTVIQCLTRWSVPFFFAVSGYFFREETTDECFRKAKHIAIITLYAVWFYIPVEIALHLLSGDLVWYIQEEFTFFNTLSFVTLNSPIFVNGHLWFLFALVYTYLTVAVLIHFNLLKYHRVFYRLLLCGHFFLAYGLFLLGIELPAGVYRNFIFEGLPFFLVGNEFWRGEKGGKRNDMRNAFLLVVVGLVMSLTERSWLGRDFSVHIGSVIVLWGLFILASNGDKINWPKFLTAVGERYSLYIYIIHPAIYLLIDELGSVLFLNNLDIIVVWFRPVYTATLSILFSSAIYYVKNKERLKE